MQRATCNGIRIRSPADARVIFHAVLLKILPMVTRRLDTEERGLISPGSVYVWEERGAHAELTGVGIERWTDGIRWGPSRVREGFLFYHEKPGPHYLFAESGYSSKYDPSRELLIKQTYTVFVETDKGPRKWHLIAYFTEESIESLKCIDDLPQLASLHVPHGNYRSARSAKGRPEHIFNPEESPTSAHAEYLLYDSGSNSGSSPVLRSPMSPRQQLSPNLLPWASPSRDVYSHPPIQQHYHQPRSVARHVRRQSDSMDMETPRNLLPPLAYLESIPMVRRHPYDEHVLRLFNAGL